MNLKIHVFQGKNCLFWTLTIRCLITDPQQRLHLNSCDHIFMSFSLPFMQNMT
ncbi:hypothetical protein NC651_007690 [Populus alba x Populus x berolinensis]|nr:hypothetical protein NC651_007690 [Populus alba x Populus x berolinensis]